ncbi:GOLPH3/VPS74 family protein [Salinispora arenicola]|uniref:GOLPH3/VPS74 family protein n=1 Tax=Salinispora arenicola TaxID=168697 RepID=UPI00037F45DB|nr:GPP34 family phosphoprotein [Salinispora arenicola]
MTALTKPLLLRDEVFLLGHDGDTGRPHIHPQALALGLAGAVLIDLFLTRHITLTPAGDPHLYPHRHHKRPTGDLIADTAITSIRHATTPPPLRGWLRAFSTDLYTRTRTTLVTTGILHHHQRRRIAGLVRTNTYLPSHTRWHIIPHARLCALANGREPPDNHIAALAGLICVLRLANHLRLDNNTATLPTRLQNIANQHYQPIRAITTAIDTTIGDLTTATYR